MDIPEYDAQRVSHLVSNAGSKAANGGKLFSLNYFPLGLVQLNVFLRKGLHLSPQPLSFDLEIIGQGF